MEGGFEESFLKHLKCKKGEFVTKQQIRAVADSFFFNVKVLNLIRKIQVLFKSNITFIFKKYLLIEKI